MQETGTLKQIVIATKNKGKIREIIDFYNKFRQIKWLTYQDFKSYPTVREGSKSFFENAKRKAKIISEFTKKTTLADDSGLVVDALDGAPGVTSSRYAGYNATDSQNRQKLIRRLSKIKIPEQRTARFVCNMILWDPQDGMIASTEGICEGVIGFEEKGSGGFGYDCIFIPAGYKKTMAELSGIEKNKISHRGRALEKLKPFFKKKLYLDQ